MTHTLLMISGVPPHFKTAIRVVSRRGRAFDLSCGHRYSSTADVFVQDAAFCPLCDSAHVEASS